jgi:hypothetical protein
MTTPNEADQQLGIVPEADPAPTQTPDSPGKDENGDGLTGGQTTADAFGDILGL